MFLDEELYLMVSYFEGTTAENIQQLNKDVCKKCEDYYKSKINATMSNKQVKVILDRTFNLFDSFVNICLRDENKIIQLFGEAFKKHNFKKQFLSNDEMRIIYMNL